MSSLEALVILHKDTEKYHAQATKANEKSDTDEMGYQARGLIRSVFAYIEGATFFAKSTAYRICLKENIELSDGEKSFAKELEFQLKNNGQVKERKAHIRFEDNIRFMFNLQNKILKSNKSDSEQIPYFNPDNQWWQQLKESIKVRDRLTHPKSLDDLVVSIQEINDTMDGFNGFLGVLEKYSNSYLEKHPEYKKLSQ